MSLSATCFLVAILGQAAPAGNESAGSQLQFGPLQAPATTTVPEQGGESLKLADEADQPAPAALQTPADAPYRSIYGSGTQPAADSAPSLGPPVSGLKSSAPAVLPATTPAELLLREALMDAEHRGISGTPVGLKTLLGPTVTGASRADGVRAYWRLARAIAAHSFAVDEHQFLMRLTTSDRGDDQPMLAAAQASAKAERAEARLAALRAQQSLAEVASPTNSGDLPLPADAPLVGVYRTYFKELNQRGAAADGLRQIDENLPVIHELIDAQAEASIAASTALSQIQRAYEQGQAPLVQVLDAHQRRSRHRRAFLEAVEQYNGEIARYALSLTLAAASGERVVGMLIRTGPGDRSVLASKKDGNGIQRVSNEEPAADPNGGPVFRPPRLDSP